MNSRLQGGFRGGMRLQGGWLTALIGLGLSLFSQKKAAKQAKEANKIAREGIAAADPYAKWRGAAAERLNALMADPSSIQNSGAYKARMQATERTIAAQGYTGSGNALAAAAEAGGQVYQQEFDNLAGLAGAGATPGAGYGNALETMQNGNAQNLSALSGVVNNATNLASSIFNRPAVATPGATG